jgi:hypothetical protein
MRAKPGLDPRPQGYYDDPHVCPGKFLPLAKAIPVWPESRRG